MKRKDERKKKRISHGYKSGLYSHTKKKKRRPIREDSCFRTFLVNIKGPPDSFTILPWSDYIHQLLYKRNPNYIM